MKGARQMPQVNLRMPAEMKAELELAAQTNQRSLTGEILSRLMSRKTENARLAATSQAFVER